jgi:DNA excision repair protein ERCC-5
MATIGWGQERVDEVLVPVIRDMNRKEAEGVQSNITNFFTVGSGGNGKNTGENGNGEAFAPRRRAEGKSKRMEKAMVSLHEQARRKAAGISEEQDAYQEGTEEPEVGSQNGKGKTKRKRAPVKRKKRGSPREGEDEDEYRDNGEGEAEEEAPAKRRRKGRKRASA